jgi:hypothetical protein
VIQSVGQQEAMNNDLSFLRYVLQTCCRYGIHPIVFGGWAEELQGKDPWKHSDVDLLVWKKDLSKVEQLISIEKNWDEIVLKRFVHKRAAVAYSIMVEFIIVHSCGKRSITDFFGTYEFTWPSSCGSEIVTVVSDRVRVATKECLAGYRAQHSHVRAAYARHSAQQGFCSGAQKDRAR